MDTSSEKIFKYLTNNNINEFFEFIKNNKDDIDLDIYDDNNIYVIQYIINFNRPDILEYIFENFNIRIDILDNDGRNLLYYPIKFNFEKIINILLNQDLKNIGISIIDVRDKMGFITIHYSCIFNNFFAFKKLYKAGSDIFISNNELDNTLDLCLKFKRNNFLLYLFDNEFKKGNFNFINSKNENFLYNSLVYENNEIVSYLMNFKEYVVKIMNHKEPEFGLTILHQMIITNNNKYIDKLLNYGINYNIPDNFGNYSYHYAIIEKNYEFLFTIFNDKYKINYNSTNINGETTLHLFLLSSDNILNDIQLKKILIKLITNTNLNIQTNQGITCLHQIIELNIWEDDEISKILKSGNKELNLFISDEDNNNSLDKIDVNKKDQFINIIVDSYYNRLKIMKNDLIVDWEKYCADSDINNVMKTFNKRSGTVDTLCKDNIKKMILEEKNSIPRYEDLKLNFDNNIVMENNCFYTGSTLDIVFGLIYLNKYSNVSFILSYPLSENEKLINYYKKIGINYSSKFEFNNIEIIWSYQKLIFISNFDSILLDVTIKEDRFIIIPLGIELTEGSHANIIIIDKKNKTIERFEPNGANEPRNFPYNKKLLDNLLKNKFEQLLTEYKYVKPSNYLPVVGFQMLEIITEEKCKMIGDPNGYCAVWCVFYCKYRLENPDVDPSILVNKIINNIKLENRSFKNVIRNFSKNISVLRDEFLNKFNLNINDWMNLNYDKEILPELENKLIDLFT